MKRIWRGKIGVEVERLFSCRLGRSERVFTLAAAFGVLIACSDEQSVQTTAVTREGLVGTVVASADTMITFDNPTTNNGSSTTCFVNGARSGLGARSCLFWWTVSNIPTNATIQSAQLRLTVSDLPNGQSGQDYPVWRVLRSWSNSGATWNDAASSAPWQTPGALGSTDRGDVVGSLVGDNLTGEHLVPLNSAGMAMLQQWISNPGFNDFGVIVAHPTNDDIVRLVTSNSSSPDARPKLEVTYTTPAIDGGSSGGGGSGGGGSAGLGGRAQ